MVETASIDDDQPAPGDAVLPDGLKVFIVGSARSGTSILFLALHTILRLSGPGESHVFPIFARMIHEFYMYRENLVAKDIKNKRVLAYRLDTRLFRAHMISFLRSFYAQQFPAGAWLDKTPGAEAILATPLIKAAFPTAKIIATKRTGVEVVRSFGVKFSTGFEENCRAWAGCMGALHQTIERFPDVLVIDQFDIANQPAEVADSIASYLGQPEKGAELGNFLRETEFNRSSTHSWQTRMTLADVDWGEDGKSIFERLCGTTMRRFGYPL